MKQKLFWNLIQWLNLAQSYRRNSHYSLHSFMLVFTKISCKVATILEKLNRRSIVMRENVEAIQWSMLIL